MVKGATSVLLGVKGLKRRYQLTSEQEEEEDHDGSVAEVQQSGHEARDVEFGDEVVDAVDEEVKSRET